MNRKTLGLVIAGLMAATVLCGWLWWSRRPVAVQPPKAAPQAADTEISIEATLYAANVVSVAVPIEGSVESFEVEIGADVYEGQLLARIRNQGLEATRDTAQLDYEKAEERVRALEIEVSAVRLESSRATADASRAQNDYERARKAYERQKMLLREGATPRMAFEKSEKEYETLAAESKKLDAVATAGEERISSVQRELDAARRVLDRKSEDVESAASRVGSGEVLSPVNGLVTARRGQVGDAVHPSMTDLFQIATDMSRMQAIADLRPEHHGLIKEGAQALVSIAEVSGAGLAGVVTKVEDGKVTIEFANPDPTLKPGVTALVRIKLT